MCIVLLSASVVWICVCVIVLYSDYICQILDFGDQTVLHLFIFLERVINVKFFETVHMSAFWVMCIISIVFCLFPQGCPVFSALKWMCLCYIFLHLCICSSYLVWNDRPV
jgi:hypothetical protein